MPGDQEFSRLPRWWGCALLSWTGIALRGQYAGNARAMRGIAAKPADVRRLMRRLMRCRCAIGRDAIAHCSRASQRSPTWPQGGAGLCAIGRRPLSRRIAPPVRRASSQCWAVDRSALTAQLVVRTSGAIRYKLSHCCSCTSPSLWSKPSSFSTQKPNYISRDSSRGFLFALLRPTFSLIPLSHSSTMSSVQSHISRRRQRAYIFDGTWADRNSRRNNTLLAAVVDLIAENPDIEIHYVSGPGARNGWIEKYIGGEKPTLCAPHPPRTLKC